MNVMKGKISVFGGAGDAGMTLTEGLACFEHHEADQRLDLFFIRSFDKSIGTSKRLNPKALYFAYRFPLPVIDRKKLQNTQFLFRNPSNELHCVAWVVDWGPNESTGRTFDVSPGVAAALDIQTDQVIEAIDLSGVSKLFSS